MTIEKKKKDKNKYFIRIARYEFFFSLIYVSFPFVEIVQKGRLETTILISFVLILSDV